MIDPHTMARAKIAVTLDEGFLVELDRLVKRGVFPNRSRAIEAAVSDRLQKESSSRLARECANLDKLQEQALADEGMIGDSDWPDY